MIGESEGRTRAVFVCFVLFRDCDGGPTEGLKSGVTTGSPPIDPFPTTSERLTIPVQLSGAIARETFRL